MRPTESLLNDMRDVLSDILTMPDFDGTLTTSVTRATIKRRARSLIKEVEQYEVEEELKR
jgi:hypothetical protein